MTIERLDYGSPDGSTWGGTSTDAIGLYGLTTVRYSAATIVASTYTVSTNSSVGFSSAESFTTMVATLSSLVQACRNFGIIV